MILGLTRVADILHGAKRIPVIHWGR